MQYLLIILCSIFFLSCQEAKQNNPKQGKVKQVAEAKLPKNRKIIRTLDISLATLDTEKASKRVEQLVEKEKGYIASINTHNQSTKPYYIMTLRIPTSSYTKFVRSLKAIGSRILYERMETQDVTEQFIDFKARLKALKTTETELQKLLTESREQKRSVNEIMQVYQELTKIREQNEQIQGKLNALDKLVEFSTINLTLMVDESSIPIVEEEWRPLETVRKSSRLLLLLLKGLVNIVIYIVIIIFPLALIISLPVIFIQLWKKRQQKITKE